MSSTSLRNTLLAGIAVVSVLLGETNLACAQIRADGWTLGPADRPGSAYDIVAPGMYVGDYSGPPTFVPGQEVINQPCSLLPTSPCSNPERGAD
jgi:hypothetical protein